MKIYSEKDKFSSGVMILLSVPLALPFFYFHTEDSKVFSLYISAIFIYILIIYFPVLKNLYERKGEPKKYILLIMSAFLLSLFSSYNFNWVKWPYYFLVVVNTVIALRGRTIYQIFLSNK